MKYLTVILTLAAAPAHAANFDECVKLAEFVQAVGNARDVGMSMTAAQAVVGEAAPPAARATMQDTVRLIYTAGAGKTPAELGMDMFNLCMEN